MLQMMILCLRRSVLSETKKFMGVHCKNVDMTSASSAMKGLATPLCLDSHEGRLYQWSET